MLRLVKLLIRKAPCERGVLTRDSAWGLRLRRTKQELALALLLMLPTANF